MKLPVTSEAALPSSTTLWRRFSDLLFDHALTAGEEIALPFARGVVGKTMAGVIILPPEPASAGAIAGIFAAYREQGASPTSCVGPMAFDGTLLPADWSRQDFRLMRLRNSAARNETPAGVMILPARAAISRFELLCKECDGGGQAVLPDRLDDTQYDALLALRGSHPIASAALQTRGQTGMVCDVLAEDGDMSSAVVATLIGRMIELAARSQLRDVFAASRVGETVYDAAGFIEIATFGVWSAQA